MADTINITSRFQGPPDSGNGGYVCGRLAAYVELSTDANAVVARLRVPPPLDTELEVRHDDNKTRLFHGDQLVAEAWAQPLDLTPIEAPSFDAASQAASRFRGHDSHWYPGCFVCGPDRGEGDGLRIFPGPLETGSVVASPWIPDASLSEDHGDRVDNVFLWSALDCPGGFAFPEPKDGSILLGELQAQILGSVHVGEACVVAAWELGRDGRKHHTASALYGQDGVCRGVARGTWFEVPNAHP
jgi:hypothetical protein